MSWFRKEKKIYATDKTVEALVKAVSPQIRILDSKYCLIPEKDFHAAVMKHVTKAMVRNYGDLKYVSDYEDCDDYGLVAIPVLRGRFGDRINRATGAAGFISYIRDDGVPHLATIVLHPGKDGSAKLAIYSIYRFVIYPDQDSTWRKEMIMLRAKPIELSERERKSIYDGLI